METFWRIVHDQSTALSISPDLLATITASLIGIQKVFTSPNSKDSATK